MLKWRIRSRIGWRVCRGKLILLVELEVWLQWRQHRLGALDMLAVISLDNESRKFDEIRTGGNTEVSLGMA